jgi:chemotaxis protein methyltransferase CheR
MMYLDEITALVQERYGLVPRNRWVEELAAKIAAMAQAGGIASQDMAQRILHDPALLANAVGALTIKESYFFRQTTHFDFLVTAVRRALARPGTRYCVWSAGCATGEEPYSVAIALRDALPSNDLSRVAIFATDADRNAIAAAESGRYSRWAFRGVRPDIVGRHFRQQPDQRFELSAEVRRQVTFRHTSIQAHVSELASASLDAIFFRNVSVYLTEQTVTEIFRGFARTLRPGGHLFVAATDLRPRLSGLAAALSQDTTIFERVATTESETPLLKSTTQSDGHHRSSRAQSSIRPPASTERPAPHSCTRRRAVHEWRDVDELADRGDLVGALALLAEKLAAGVDAAQIYQRRGSIHLALGDFAAAIEDFRRVLYHDPEDSVARYWYALALSQAGHRKAAHHQLCLVVAAVGNDNEVLRSTAQALIGELA